MGSGARCPTKDRLDVLGGLHVSTTDEHQEIVRGIVGERESIDQSISHHDARGKSRAIEGERQSLSRHDAAFAAVINVE